MRPSKQSKPQSKAIQIIKTIQTIKRTSPSNQTIKETRPDVCQQCGEAECAKRSAAPPGTACETLVLSSLPLSWISPAFLEVLVPLHYPPPHGPCAYRPAHPKFAARTLFWHPKSHQKNHSIFECILAPKITPKAIQNKAEIDPKSIICSSAFSSRVFFSF